jgi:hypothetical protein
MTLTSLLNTQQATLDLLAATIEENKHYVANFGYPSGRACPHCGKEAFGTPAILDQLAAAPPGSNLAHEYCVEIADLKAKLAKLQADPPTIHMVQLPNPKAQDDDPANPDATEPAPASDPANPDAKEDARASA